MTARGAPATRFFRRAARLMLPAEFQYRFAHELVTTFDALRAERGSTRALLAEMPALVRLAVQLRRAARSMTAEPQHSSRRDPMLTSIMHDIRYAVRTLRRNPGFTAIVVTTLALGIGANTAIFSVVNGVLLSPLALDKPNELVLVGESTQGATKPAASSTSPASFFEWKESAHSMQIAGFYQSGGVLTGRGDASQLLGASVVGGLFDVLRVRPVFGRTLVVSDEVPGNSRVIVLSYGLWQRLFGDNRNILDSTVVLNGTARTVVGVMPADFRFPTGSSQFWVPARFDAAFRGNRDQYMLLGVGRLAPGASLAQATVELETIASRLRRDWPKVNAHLRIDAIPLRNAFVSGVETRLYVLMGAVAFVLLITCANLGNLQLARASGRRREIAVRRALGAGRGRIARQLLTESLLLACTGGLLGVGAGKLFLKLLLAAQATTNLPRVAEIHLNATVLAFTLAISVGAGLFFGLLPALDLTRDRSHAALREGARGSGAQRWTRSSLVVVEVALAVMLLAGAGLLLRSFALLQRVDPGFTNTELLTFDVSAPPNTPTFYAASLDAIRALPGVQSAELVSQLPVTGRGIGAWFNRIDKPLPENVTPTGEAYRVVTPGFFNAIGLRLVSGRLLTDDDRRDRPAVVINRALAEKYYPGEDPIGKEIYLGAPDNRFFDHGPIVGVVGNTRDAGLAVDPIPIVYIPQAVLPTWNGYSYIVRAKDAPLALVAPAREAIRTISSSAPVRNMRLMTDVLGESVASARWSTTLLGVFAAIALVMAAVGVFGVLSFLVAQRTREIGIRIALGAAPGSLRTMIVGQGLVMVSAGIAVGSAGALALTRLMATMLYGVAPTDAVTYAAVATLLVAVGFLASYLPALRATRIDPLVAMRAE